jgi:hypothetical protein
MWMGEDAMKYPARPGRLDRLTAAVHVVLVGSRKSAHRAVLDGAGDRVHRLPVAVGRGRKPRLDDIDLEPLELPGNPHLLIAGHRSAGTLLAVAQGRVENDQVVCHGPLHKDA